MFQSKIIHIFSNDKFTNPAIKLFEDVIPNKSIYIVIRKTKGDFIYASSKMIKSRVLNNIDDILALVNEINQSDSNIVFFHSLNNFKIKIANSLNDSIVKVWFIWGYDLYGSWEILKKRLYTTTTKHAVNDKTRFKLKLKRSLIFNRTAYNLFLRYRQDKISLPTIIRNLLNNNFNTEYYRALQKMDVIVPVLPTEYKIIQTIGLKAKFAPFTYGCIEDLLGANINNNVLNSQNILVGNSADPSNNHIDIFKSLSKLNLDNKKVYVPLSYGGGISYINSVSKKGKQYLGENFIPLTEYMPLDKYNEILLSCGFVIFNHKRQQGIGNIISSGYLGAKIFLNKSSPAYNYYKHMGINIFNISDLNIVNLKENLSVDQLLKNRTILFKLYSHKAVCNKIRELCEVIETIKK